MDNIDHTTKQDQADVTELHFDSSNNSKLRYLYTDYLLDSLKEKMDNAVEMVKKTRSYTE